MMASNLQGVHAILAAIREHFPGAWFTANQLGRALGRERGGTGLGQALCLLERAGMIIRNGTRIHPAFKLAGQPAGKKRPGPVAGMHARITISIDENETNQAT